MFGLPRLLWVSYVRYLRKNLWLLLLSVSAIATGVAVILAIDVASISARLSFDLSTQALTGRSTHSLLGAGSELSEEIYPRLRVEWGLRPSAPVVTGYVSFPRDGAGPTEMPLTLSLMGVDPLADQDVRGWTGGSQVRSTGEEDGRGRGWTDLMGSTDEVVATEETARRLQWEVGTQRTALVGVRRVELTLAGTFRPASDRSGSALDNVLLTDISTAQVILDQVGRLDRVDLVLKDPDQVEALRAKLPPDVHLQKAGQSQETAKQLSSAFHINLRALSYLCLLVATFLIFNVVSFTVAHRRQSLGRLRILGVTGRQLTRLLMGEALLLGVFGSLLGVLGGLAMGRGLVPLVTRTLNDLYYVHSITRFTVDPLLLLKAFACGGLATLLAAALPALKAARTEPLQLLHRVNDRSTDSKVVAWTAGLGVLLLGAAALTVRHPSLTAGLFCLLLIVLGAGLLVPFFLSLAVQLAVPLSGRIDYRMAMRGLSAYIGRTGLAAVALTIAVGATVSIGMMVSSFRGTLTNWLETTLTADIYLTLQDKAGLISGQSLSPSEVQRALQLPQVTDWTGQRVRVVPSSTGETFLVGVRSSPRYEESLVFLESEPNAWQRFREGEGIFVTEPYARRNGFHPGSTLKVATEKGERELTVLGVYFSYAPDRNMALWSWEAMQEAFDEESFSGLGLYLSDGADPDQVVSDLRAVFGEAVDIRATGKLKRLALEIFERTFTVTEVLRFLALGVAFIGVFLSLFALALERSAEVRVLRALGLKRSELLGLSLLQSGTMGLVTGVLAFPLGMVLAYVMIAVINRRAFGWTITFTPDWSGTVLSLALGLGAALLAGLYPAWLWSRSREGALRERE